MLTIDAVTHLNRSSERRSDAEWLAAARHWPTTRTIVLVDLKPLVTEQGGLMTLCAATPEQIAALGLDPEPALFLGIDRNTHGWFALALDEPHARRIRVLEQLGAAAVELRRLATEGLLKREALSLAGQARALAEWHRTARCCGTCGGAMSMKDGGWRRHCWACGRDAFPRTDPVVIMLPVSGDRCVLARGVNFPSAVYSALAGFLEPGEDIERAVGREVREEIGLEVCDVLYQESQPWPFPHSLMIGCRALVEDQPLRLDPKEIAEAYWVSRLDAAAMLAGNHRDGWKAPGRHAIARELLAAFVEDRPLRSIRSQDVTTTLGA